MAEQMNIGDMHEHINLSELAKIMVCNSKISRITKETVYDDIIELSERNYTKEPKMFKWIITDDRTYLLDKTSPLFEQSFFSIVNAYRKVKLFNIDYSSDCQEDWTITRLSNHITRSI